MAEDPIKAPPEGLLGDSGLNVLMTEVLNVSQGFLPGATITLLVSFPEGFPGLVETVPGARVNYMSTGQREDMANTMLELLKRWGKV